MLSKELEDAIWAGDVNKLSELAGCICCCDEHTFEHCDEHTFEHCPARVWDGCRGQGTMTRSEEVSWAIHYEKHHGLSREQFFVYDQR